MKINAFRVEITPNRDRFAPNASGNDPRPTRGRQGFLPENLDFSPKSRPRKAARPPKRPPRNLTAIQFLKEFLCKSPSFSLKSPRIALVLHEMQVGMILGYPGGGKLSFRKILIFRRNLDPESAVARPTGLPGQLPESRNYKF